MSGDDPARSYYAIAGAYAERFGDELDHKPLDRALIALFAEDAGGAAPVVDVGCGPGHITQHLHDLGCEAVGIDLSPAMIALARARHPALRFEVASMLALPFADRSVGGIAALYSIIHLTDAEL